MSYDAILVVSFGGPESREDVIPFLENVLRGRNVPRERMLAVAEHYYHFDGKSPINQQTRDLIAALEVELAEHGPKLPVYWGNRNWHPMLAAAVRQMKDDGIQRAVAFVTSAYSSYSGAGSTVKTLLVRKRQLGTERRRSTSCAFSLIIRDFWTRLQNACRTRCHRCRMKPGGTFKLFTPRTAFPLPWPRPVITCGNLKK